MRSMAVVDYGSGLRPQERSRPELKPGEALVEVIACGVCQSDVKVVRGNMPFSATLLLPPAVRDMFMVRVTSLMVAPAGMLPAMSN